MANLTTIFKSDATDPHDADKLVDLFRNRAELKKEFAALRNEKYELQDRVKHHQGATARVQQQLQHLENLLLDPEWVYNVVAFYQLRLLAMHCNKQLVRFAEELKQQREKRVHGLALKTWNQQRTKEAEQIQARVGEKRVALQVLEDGLLSAQQALTDMGGVKKLFQGRTVTAEIEEIEAGIALAQQQEQELLQELQAVENRDPPDHQGLDIAAKRSINCMILSFAQQMYLHFEEDGLVQLAKEASEKSVGAINYGNKKDCDELLERLQKRKDAEHADASLPGALRRRAELIGKAAQFRHDDDAVPIPATVSTIFSIDANDVVRRSDCNILGQNYFGIAKVLSR
ncbi:MAG: hypothetical protein WBN44_09125 [Woeseiaceae bacterium]